MTFEVERVIAAHHPALEGHFPGNPVVPGALILDEVLQAARQWRGDIRLKEIRSVKFSSPLKPGDAFSIELREANRSELVFECRSCEVLLASGTLSVEPNAGGA